MGVCRPDNDNRRSAMPLSPALFSELVVTGTTLRSTRDGPTVTGCGAAATCSDGPNVWYRLDVASNTFVYIDTAGSSTDTYLLIAIADPRGYEFFLRRLCPAGGVIDEVNFWSPKAQRPLKTRIGSTRGDCGPGSPPESRHARANLATDQGTCQLLPLQGTASSPASP